MRRSVAGVPVSRPPSRSPRHGDTSPSARAEAKAPAPVAGYQVVKVYPHDRQAFTQGLQYVDGVLYEGTGQHGQSGIRKVKLETGEVAPASAARREVLWRGHHRLGRHARSADVAVRDRVRLRQDHVQAAEDLHLHRRGLGPDARRHAPDHERRHRAALRFLDPATLKETGRVVVRDGGAPVDDLNELEYVKGRCWPTSGRRTASRASRRRRRGDGWIDLTGLLDPRDAAGATS